LAITSKKKNIENESLNNVKREVYITKVVLENFLSFQKDEIVFNASKFIIIVGPNWSGKTSIFQAIKFALGSNERDERYSKWSDFIRHGQNYAIVEIHICNKKELIKIRRTVIRGQSPFFSIKKNQDKEFRKIQAIEIQKLISEMKYNPDNQFAIVSQGKIDAIKNLKPTELCTFLEEGIGLKGLRNEILQQKNSIQNLKKELESLITKKNTLNINLELLEPKLERLKEKKKLIEIRKGYEDELLWANREKLEKEIDILYEEIKNNELKNEELKREIDKNNKEIEEIQKKIDVVDQKINNLSEELGENKFKRQELINKIQNWHQKKILMKDELDNLADKLVKAEKILANYTGQKSNLNRELKSIISKKVKIENKINSLIKEQTELANKIQRNKKFLEKYNDVVSEKELKLKRIKENEEEIKRYNDLITQIFQSFKDIEHKLEKNKWFLKNPTKNLLKELDFELRKISNKLYDVETNIEKLELQKSKNFGKLKQLQISLNQRRVILPTNITLLKDEISKIPSLENVKGPIINYLKYNDELSYAIESVLGENLLFSFIADNWESLNLLKRLKNKYNAYCNIYITKKLKIMPFPKISAPGVLGYLADLIKIIQNDPDVKKVIYSKIKNCLVVKDYRSGIELYKNIDFKGKCVTLKGEQIVSYKYVYETPYMKRLKGFLSAGTQKEQSIIIESEIKNLSDKISELKVEASKLDSSQREIFKKKEAFNDLLYNFNQKQRLTSKKNKLYDERTNLENLNASLKDEINLLNIEIKKLEAQKDQEFFKWNDRIKAIPNELNDYNEEKKNWEKKIEKNKEILIEVKEQVRINLEKVNKIKQEHKKKQEQFLKADKEAFKIYRNLEILKENIEEIEKEILELKEEKSQIQENKSIFDKKNIQLQLNLEQQNIKLNSIKSDLQQKKESLKRINKEIGKKKKVKIRPINEIKQDLEKIEKKILKYYDVDDSILVERDQILVNLKELSKNEQDLEEDIKSAMKTENKLEDMYYEKFKIVLNDLKTKINQKFKISQLKFFCSLILTGSFEELGVEIKAATSKEQLRSCTALSGGQISMISICLILSLQEIKPSPLCMFDEAGMFLDDKNSEITYQLIKSTLEKNPIQLLMFLPKSSNALYLLADKLIGIARTGKNDVSTVFIPKIIEKEI